MHNSTNDEAGSRITPYMHIFLMFLPTLCLLFGLFPFTFYAFLGCLAWLAVYIVGMHYYAPESFFGEDYYG